LRSLFQRAQCTEQELRTLHGVVTSFAGPRERRPKIGGADRPRALEPAEVLDLVDRSDHE
jgi:tRNA C32,U32 (ribose-2'-O)-methylase TrmJ